MPSPTDLIKKIIATDSVAIIFCKLQFIGLHGGVFVEVSLKPFQRLG